MVGLCRAAPFCRLRFVLSSVQSCCLRLQCLCCIYLLYVPAWACARAHLWRPENSGHELVPSTMSVPRIELRLPGWAGRNFTQCCLADFMLGTGLSSNLSSVIDTFICGGRNQAWSLGQSLGEGSLSHWTTTPVPDVLSGPGGITVLASNPGFLYFQSLNKHWDYANTPPFLPWLTLLFMLLCLGLKSLMQQRLGALGIQCFQNLKSIVLKIVLHPSPTSHLFASCTSRNLYITLSTLAYYLHWAEAGFSIVRPLWTGCSPAYHLPNSFMQYFTTYYKTHSFTCLF